MDGLEEKKRKITFLRTSTGKGSQECYEALAKANGDLSVALAIINKGIDEYVSSAEGGSKTQIIDLLHGRVATVMTPQIAVLLEVRCETDFVSRNNIFISLTKSLANAMLDIAKDEQVDIQSCGDEYLGNTLMDMRCLRCSKTAKDTAALAKMALRERFIVTRLGFVKTGPEEYLTSYLHGSTSGTYPLNLVGCAASALKFKFSETTGEAIPSREELLHPIQRDEFTPTNSCCLEGSECIYSNDSHATPTLVSEEDTGLKRKVKTFVKQVVQHIVGARPVAMTLEDYDKEKVAEAREILEREAIESGKPKDKVDLIVEGRLRKQFGDFVLMEQKWPFDGGKPSVSSALRDFEKKNKVQLQLTQMMQFSIADDLLTYKPPNGACFYNINLMF